MTMKFAWGEIDKHIIENYDLIITSASYEERCLSLADNFPCGRLTQALIFHLHEYNDYVSTNLSSLKTIFKEKNVESKVVELSHGDPIESIDRIIECLDSYLSSVSTQKVIVDITTFTHEIVLMLLMLFKQKYNKIDVTFAYSNAKDYDQSEDGKSLQGGKWLSKGIDEIRSILGYPGDLFPAQQTHLIVIVGYEYDRAISIITEMEPTSLSLAFGKSNSFTAEAPDTNGKHYGAREHFEEVVSDAISIVPKGRIYDFDISCNDPQQAKADIQKHLSQYSEAIDGKNIVLFPLNNKVSTLGAGLLALERRDIQLCYAPALVYNYSNYSIPGDECYLFKPFGEQ